MLYFAVNVAVAVCVVVVVVVLVVVVVVVAVAVAAAAVAVVVVVAAVVVVVAFLVLLVLLVVVVVVVVVVLLLVYSQIDISLQQDIITVLNNLKFSCGLTFFEALSFATCSRPLLLSVLPANGTALQFASKGGLELS